MQSKPFDTVHIFCQLMLSFCNTVPGDVELTNMQLKPEALNSLKLPVRVKAGFLGSVKLKVGSSRFHREGGLHRIFSLVVISFLQYRTTDAELVCSICDFMFICNMRTGIKDVNIIVRFHGVGSDKSQFWFILIGFLYQLNQQHKLKVAPRMLSRKQKGVELG